MQVLKGAGTRDTNCNLITDSPRREPYCNIFTFPLFAKNSYWVPADQSQGVTIVDLRLEGYLSQQHTVLLAVLEMSGCRYVPIPTDVVQLGSTASLFGGSDHADDDFWPFALRNQLLKGSMRRRLNGRPYRSARR